MEKYFFTPLLFFSFFFLSLHALKAQTEQVAFSSGITEISANKRAQIGILEEYKLHFERARLYISETGEYSIEVLYEDRGKTWTERYPLSIKELEQIRSALSSAPLISDGKKGDGRLRFVLGATIPAIAQGVFLSYGTSRKVNGTSWTGGLSYERTSFGRFVPYLYPAGMFFGSLIASHGKQMNPAASNMLLWGSAAGIAHGAGLELLLEGKNAFSSINRLGMLGFASVTEGWILYSLAKNKNISYAHSMAWNTGNIWGLQAGTSFGFLFAEGNSLNLESGARMMGVGLLGMSAGTMLLTDYLHRINPRTAGDYDVLNSFLLSTAGIGGVMAFESESLGVFGAAGLVSFAVGMSMGYALTANTKFSRTEGLLIFAGTYLGYVVGSGLVLAVEPEVSTATLLIPSIGSLVGWVATYLYFRTDNRKKSKTQGKSSLQYGLNPNGLLFAMQSPEQQYRQLAQPIRSEFASLRWSF